MVQSSDNEKIKINLSDGQTAEIDIKIAKFSKKFADQLDGDVPEEGLEEPEIKEHVFKKCIEYMTHLAAGNNEPKLEKPLPDVEVHTLLATQEGGEFYANYLNSLGEEELFEVILAANTLDIPSLLEICAAKVSRMIKDMEINQIR